MNPRGNDALRELLAAQYVLGTLRGGARRRFEAWLRDDAELRALVARWDGRLAPLAELIPESTPPERIWHGIVARLPVLGERPRTQVGWFESLAFWRGLAGALALIAVVAIGLPYLRSPGTPAELAKASYSYVATIEEDQTHRPVALMMMSEHGNEVVLQLTASAAPVPKGRVLQLWMANPAGSGVVSAGLVPAGDANGPVRFEVPDPERLRASGVLGLSLEPPGGSPSATHVLGFGKWTRLAS